MTFDIRASRGGGNPCKDCPDRYPACSGHCKKPEYLAYREEQAKIKAARDAYHSPAWVSPEMDGGRYRKHKKYK
jgi:hypothetical protein